MNVVCGVLKLYFRELPEPLVPTELFHRLAQMLGKITQPPPPHPTPSLRGLQFYAPEIHSVVA